MKKLIITPIACLLIGTALHAQVQRCGTTEYYELRKKADPTLEQRMKDQEKQIATWIEKNPQGLKTSAQQKIQFPSLPGFKPTGNETTDRINYAKQKQVFLGSQNVQPKAALPVDAEKTKLLREKKLKAHSTFTNK